MTESDKADFAVAIGAMCAAFGTDASKALMLGYWMGLSDLELRDIQTAVARSMRESQHLPRPVELRKLAGETTAGDRAEIAWNELQQAIPLGPYKHIDFGDGAINATVRSLGGWPSFLLRFDSADGEMWARKDFMTTYTRLSAIGLSDEAMAWLPGITEMQPTPVRIESRQPTNHARIGQVQHRISQRRGEPI